MGIIGKNVCIRRWLAGLLLAAYGSAGVLGYGLHAVWECEHHCQVHSHIHGVAHAHDHDDAPGCHYDHELGRAVADRGTDHKETLNLAVGDCPICEFLVQAQTPFVMELTGDCVSPTLSICILLEGSYVAPIQDTHPARGPPIG